jgi:uracil-DNA glycosylase
MAASIIRTERCGGVHSERDPAKVLHAEIAGCTVCAAHLLAGPRPIVQFGATAKILIIGQAPGAKVHASGTPWQDDSGDRLRAWTGLDTATFYDPAKVALMPMGFCYPGKGSGGDLPPRPECAPLWHDRISALLPRDRLTLLIGTYAQNHYLTKRAGRTLTETVRSFRDLGPAVIPLPHPAWRVTLWMKKNPWFEDEVLPILATAVQARLA